MIQELLIKNNVYQLSKLQEGDRFYFCNDRRKIVWQVKGHARVKQKGFTKNYCLAINDAKIQQRFEDERHVVYLRNINEVAA
jgi:elongation factor P hydroxylase